MFSVTIKPKKGWIGLNLKELIQYRELFYILSWRDIKVRYKQTVIGIFWAILQPFVMMVVFSVFFGALIKVPSDGIPYPIFVFSGLLFWNYFSMALSTSSTSLTDNENIIKKIYFPRLMLPLSPALTPLVDFALALVVLSGMMWFYNFTPTLEGILIFPLLIFLSFVSAAGLGIFLATINVRYRDIKYILPFFIQFLLFVTPVIYPTTIVPEQFRWLLGLNPMTGIIQAARNGLLGQGDINYNLLGVSALISVTLFIFAIFYFRRTERVFADVA